MMSELSGSMKLLDLLKPAFTLRSTLGPSDAVMFVRKFMRCCARGCSIVFDTGTWSESWKKLMSCCGICTGPNSLSRSPLAKKRNASVPPLTLTPSRLPRPR